MDFYQQPSMFGFFESYFPIIFMIVFGVILITFIVMMFSGLSRWNKNNHSPVLTVSAKVVNLRSDVSHMHTSSDIHHSSSRMIYYASFEVESGDRIELQVNGPEYGQLALGDTGSLTFQGTRYKSFARYPEGAK